VPGYAMLGQINAMLKLVILGKFRLVQVKPR